jgi:WD40 repeat protein/tRNA A-37 threonylcarbamoyl transferase component Bud32
MNECEIFLAAIDKATLPERQAFLDQACGGNAELRRRVEALLESHGQAGSLLEHPALTSPTVTLKQGEAPTDGAADPNNQPDPPDEIPLDFLTPADDPDALGRIGPYLVTGVVGRGGMGVVLKARDAKLNRVVAIKVMAPELASNATARKRFLREAQAAAAVVHQHVVTIHAVDEERLPYLVMEYIDGQSLQEKIAREGHLELKEILRIGLQVTLGLAAAHAHGLMHRDVKPANILLENGVERVRITDFGLARAVDDVGMTRTGEVCGSPQYMSPEQAQGQAMDARSDLFSLGSVLYAMCTGRPPFRAETALATARRVCEDTPRAIREINPEAPPWLVEVIDRLLAKQPAQRFQTAQEVADLLGRRLAEVQHPSMTYVTSPSASGAGSEGRGRRRWVIAAAAVLCLCVGLGLAEGTGTTRLAATIIRIFTPEGTLVVESDDPGASVAIRGDAGKWVLLFNGKDLTGWKVHPDQPGSWRVEDGELVGNSPEGQLFSERGDYENFHLRTEAKINGRGDSGIFFRSEFGLNRISTNKKGQQHAFPRGYEAQICSNDQNTPRTGSLRGFGPTATVSATLVPPDTWFTMEVIANGRHLAVKVNGQTTVDLVDEQDTYRRGHFALQSFYAGVDVRFRNIEVKELPPRTTIGVRAPIVRDPDSVTRASGSLADAVRDSRKGDALPGIELIRTFPREHRSDVRDVSVSADGGRAVSAGGNDRTMRSWDVIDGRQLRVFEDHGNFVGNAVIAPDGTWAVSTDAGEGRVLQWDLETGELLRELDKGHGAPIHSLAVSPDGKLIVTGGVDRLVRVFDAETGMALRRIDVGKVCLDAVFLPDNVRALFGMHQGMIRLVDLTTGETVREWQTGRESVDSLAVTADATLAAAGGRDGDLHLWRLDSDEFVRHWQGHDAHVYSLAFLNEGRSLVSGGDDGRLVVWDVATGRPLAQRRWETHCTPFFSVLPDGRTLLSGGGTHRTPDGRYEADKDYALHLWRLPQPSSASSSREGEPRSNGDESTSGKND